MRCCRRSRGWRAPEIGWCWAASDDGGYYLIGIKRLHHRLFEQIDWSTERVFAQTLERAREIGLETELLPTWYDVDDAATLDRLRRELTAPSRPNRGWYDAKHTRAYLESLQVAPPSFSASSAC